MPRVLHYSDVENVYDDPQRVGRLAGLLGRLDGPDALVAGSGDNTAPGVLATVERGAQALPFFESVGADLDTFGNHDFDFGPERTRELVAESPQVWVSANTYLDGERFAAAEGVVPWLVTDVDGARIGVVGVTDPATDSLNPAAAELTFTDPVAAAREAVAELREEGVDHLVALSHLGAGDDALAESVPFDAVLGGHVHSQRLEYLDGTLLCRPGANGERVFEVTFDADGATAAVHETRTAPVDEALAAQFSGRLEHTGLDEVVGHVEDPIDRSEAVVNAGECRIGNFVADAYRWATGADVGLQNSGGIRAGPPLSGDVTVADLVSVVPFEEPVVVAEVTGAELRAALGQASGSAVDFGEPGTWHAHLSGVRVVWDDERDELVDVEVDGEPLDPDRRYTVALAEYLLHSEHEFPAITERHRAGEDGIQHDVLAAYARERGIDPRVEGRVRRVQGKG